MLRSIAQCQKRDGRVVGVRSECRSVDDAVAGIPSSTWTGTVYQHLDAVINANRDVFQAAAGATKLAQSKNRKCGGHDPANRLRNPWPAKLVRVKTDAAIHRSKLPFPQPIGFSAHTFQQPTNATQPRRYGAYNIAKGDHSYFAAQKWMLWTSKVRNPAVA